MYCKIEYHIKSAKNRLKKRWHLRSVIFDRKEAILESLESLVNSKPGSALLIAGKGNENYQEFENGLRKDFSDFEVVMRFKNAI